MMRPVTVHVDRAIPDAPTDLAFTRGSVILTWDDATPVDYADPTTWANPKNEIGFRIERALVTAGLAGPFAEVGTALANVTTFTDNPPDPYETYAYRVIAWNVAGVSLPSAELTVPGLPRATTTVVTSDINPSVVGQLVTFTATVNAPAATGTVQFNIDGVDVGVPQAVSGGVATYATSSLAFGTHPVVATYSGDAAFLASTSPTFDQVVNLTGTTVRPGEQSQPVVRR